MQLPYPVRQSGRSSTKAAAAAARPRGGDDVTGEQLLIGLVLIAVTPSFGYKMVMDGMDIGLVIRVRSGIMPLCLFG